MNIMNINTERLTLIPVTLDITRSLLEGRSDEIEKIGILTDKMWPTSDTKDMLPIINRTLEKNLEPTGFEFWMIAQKDKKVIIGDIGFHGKPNTEGEVQIEFGFVEHERGKGFGYEALKGIMDWLRNQEGVRVVIADCLIDNQAAMRILEKVGMQEAYRNDEHVFWKFIK